MKKFPFSLSWKLTLCSILMMLLMWAAVGVVLVLNTAEEIMAAQDDEAQRRADLVIQYGDVDTIGYYYRLDQGDHWIGRPDSGAAKCCFLKKTAAGPAAIPSTQSSGPSVRTMTAGRSGQRPFLAFRSRAPRRRAVERPVSDLSGELLPRRSLCDPGAGPPQRRHSPHPGGRARRSETPFFRADTITIGDKSFTNHRTNGQDTYFLGESGEPLEENSYSFSPHLLDRTRMEMMNAVRCHVHGLTIAHPLYERKSSILESYSSGYAFQYDNEEPDLSCSVEVFLLSTPLKSALQEHLGILLRLLLLAPVLGLLFAWAIRKIVVRPLEKTKADFGRVARLDFRGWRATPAAGTRSAA